MTVHDKINRHTSQPAVSLLCLHVMCPTGLASTMMDMKRVGKQIGRRKTKLGLSEEKWQFSKARSSNVVPKDKQSLSDFPWNSAENVVLMCGGKYRKHCILTWFPSQSLKLDEWIEQLKWWMCVAGRTFPGSYLCALFPPENTLVWTVSFNLMQIDSGLLDGVAGYDFSLGIMWLLQNRSNYL